MTQRQSQTMRSPRYRTAGFTLMELMIVVAIVGILAAIAYPSYRDSVQKSRRGQVKAEMVELTQILERCFSNANSYGNCFNAGNNLAALPEYGASPRNSTGTDRFYNLSIASTGAAPILNYTITATAINDQADDRCANLTINQQGVRGTSSGNADCW